MVNDEWCLMILIFFLTDRGGCWPNELEVDVIEVAAQDARIHQVAERSRKSETATVGTPFWAENPVLGTDTCEGEYPPHARPAPWWKGLVWKQNIDAHPWEDRAWDLWGQKFRHEPGCTVQINLCTAYLGENSGRDGALRFREGRRPKVRAYIHVKPWARISIGVQLR